MAHSKHPENDYLPFPSLDQIEEVVRSLMPASDLVIGWTTIKTHGRITQEDTHFCGEKGQIKTLRAVNRKRGTYLNLSFSYTKTYYYAVGFWNMAEKKNACVLQGSTKDYRYALSQFFNFKG